jgi:hypothetical protein
MEAVAPETLPGIPALIPICLQPFSAGVHQTIN